MELKTAKGRLIFFLLLIIFLPLLDDTLNLIESGKLEGYIALHPDTHFSPAGWWDGSYQKEKTLHINDSVGFRPDLVRMNNQIDLWVFKKISDIEVYLGGKGQLFSKEYVDDYEGRKYMGDSLIRSTLIKVKLIQDTLERMGKSFIFTYAPSKPYFMPENIPWSLRRSSGPKMNNYQTFKRIGDSLKIKQLDFNGLFIAMKETSKSPLFSAQGVHWSYYGSLLATDTLTKFIEQERKIKMPELVITKLSYPDTIIEPDNDLAKCSNLIFQMPREKLCYPEYHYSASNGATKPKVIFIGDSFLWLWLYNGFMRTATTYWEFWYYFHEVTTPNGRYTIDGTIWIKPMLETDCIVTVYAPQNLRALSTNYMFVENMYNYFYPNKNKK